MKPNMTPGTLVSPLKAEFRTQTKPELARRQLVGMLGLAGAGAAASALSACVSNGSSLAAGTDIVGQTSEALATGPLYFTSVGTLGDAPGPTLRGTPGSAAAAIAILEGYARPGDGGGGLFYWSQTGLDDGGTIFAASASDGGAPAGYWIRIYSGPLNVRWFGAAGTGGDDTVAVKKAYLAAKNLNSATVYFPAGMYGISSTVTIGDQTNANYTSISTLGEGATTSVLLWLGSASDQSPTDTAVRYWRNKYATMSGIGVQNGAGKTGTSIGTLLTGLAEGTQSNGLIFSNCHWTGFGIGVQAGDAGNISASELVFIDCTFASCSSGFAGSGSGDTLNIWFYGCSFVANVYGANLGSAGSVHFWGGGSHGNTIATIFPNSGAWQGTMHVEGFRFELLPPEVAVGVGDYALSMESCIFTADPPPSYPVIQSAATASVRGCVFGYFGQTGWMPYEDGQNGAGRSVEMTGNIIYGVAPICINPQNSGSNGLRYSLSGNIYNGAMNGNEVGRIVWPNRVNDSVDGSSVFTGRGTCAVAFTARDGADYKVTVAGSANENFWVTNKTATGFTLNSSNGSSTASVDWVLSR